jgi:uncharacterized Zn-binding protein involved in type VI secretion
MGVELNMTPRLAIAASLMAGAAGRKILVPGDAREFLGLADVLIEADKASTTWNVGVDVAAGESETVAVQVVPTVYYGDFAFEAGDRCECTDGETRTAFCCEGYTTASVGGWLAFHGSFNDVHFYGATVYRGGKPVAVLSGDPATKKPEPFALQVGDVAVGNMCNRVILSTSPLAWVIASTDKEPRVGVRTELAYPATAQSIREEFAVWRGGVLVREAVA